MTLRLSQARFTTKPSRKGNATRKGGVFLLPFSYLFVAPVAGGLLASVFIFSVCYA